MTVHICKCNVLLPPLHFFSYVQTNALKMCIFTSDGVCNHYGDSSVAVYTDKAHLPKT